MRFRTCGLILLATLTAASPAQPGPTYLPCLDTWTLNSSSVFVARIVEVCSASRCGGSNVVALNVQRTLKGTQPRQLKIAIDASPDELKDWKHRKASLLIFDGLNASPNQDPAQPTAEALDLSDPELSILNANLEPLHGADPILEATGSILQNHPGVDHILTFPRMLLDETRGLDASLPPLVPVPVSPSLEAWARSTLLGPPHPAIDQALRPEAVAALQFFPSPANTALLRSLLNDPASTVQPAEFNLGLEVRTFPVRLEAYTVLKEWKIDVAEPVTKEQASKPEAVRVASLSNHTGMIGQTEIKSLARFENLEQLELRNDHLTAQAYGVLPRLAGLRALGLAGSNITDGKLPILVALNNLEALDLSGTKITDAGLRTIANFPYLKSLNLTQSRVTAEAVRELQSQRPDIRVEFR